jgi:hypothetical protein
MREKVKQTIFRLERHEISPVQYHSEDFVPRIRFNDSAHHLLHIVFYVESYGNEFPGILYVTREEANR